MSGRGETRSCVGLASWGRSRQLPGDRELTAWFDAERGDARPPDPSAASSSARRRLLATSAPTLVDDAHVRRRRRDHPLRAGFAPIWLARRHEQRSCDRARRLRRAPSRRPAAASASPASAATSRRHDDGARTAARSSIERSRSTRCTTAGSGPRRSPGLDVRGGDEWETGHLRGSASLRTRHPRVPRNSTRNGPAGPDRVVGASVARAVGASCVSAIA